MLEKLGGLVTIVVGAVGLVFISVLKPPLFVQIICAIAGSFVCLIGIVFLFAEGQIFTKDRRVKKAPKVG
jgi:hypothetical protein